MNVNIRLYDAVLTEGARWLAVLQKEHRTLVVQDESLVAPGFKFFLEIARVASTYDIDVYTAAPWWKYLWLKYIKKFKFLKRPPKTTVFYIDAKVFMEELAKFFKLTPMECYEMYNNYGVRR